MTKLVQACKEPLTIPHHVLVNMIELSQLCTMSIVLPKLSLFANSHMGMASRLLKSAWVFALRENLPLLQTLQTSHAQDRMAFVVLWSYTLGNFFFLYIVKLV
jgi:hypothetical protein